MFGQHFSTISRRVLKKLFLGSLQLSSDSTSRRTHHRPRRLVQISRAVACFPPRARDILLDCRQQSSSRFAHCCFAGRALHTLQTNSAPPDLRERYVCSLGLIIRNRSPSGETSYMGRAPKARKYAPETASGLAHGKAGCIMILPHHLVPAAIEKFRPGFHRFTAVVVGI